MAVMACGDDDGVNPSVRKYAFCVRRGFDKTEFAACMHRAHAGARRNDDQVRPGGSERGNERGSGVVAGTEETNATPALMPNS